MMDQAMLRRVIERACFAPSVHNTQPARWRPGHDRIRIAADLSVALDVGDPELRDMALSCGASLEATVLALSEHGVGAEVSDLWDADDQTTCAGHRMVADIRFGSGKPDPLHAQLEARFTWRDHFAAGAPTLFGWTRTDTNIVLDRPTVAHIAVLNDRVSLDIMRDRGFRRELLSWMRLGTGAAVDGMTRANLRMSGFEARAAGLALGPLWPLLDRCGLTAGLTAEADKTNSAPMIVAFHRPKDESPVASGRAYLRMWLEATSLGLAGWPMAAMSDDPAARGELCTMLGIPSDRRLIQVLRFGAATGEMSPRTRRPYDEVLV